MLVFARLQFLVIQARPSLGIILASFEGKELHTFILHCIRVLTTAAMNFQPYAT